MGEPETFIITVRCVEEGVELDMELPSGIPAGELRGQALNVLKSVYPDRFEAWAECRLSHGPRVLRDGETLAESGIFDGNYLDVNK